MYFRRILSMCVAVFLAEFGSLKLPITEPAEFALVNDLTSLQQLVNHFLHPQGGFG